MQAPVSRSAQRTGMVTPSRGGQQCPLVAEMAAARYARASAATVTGADADGHRLEYSAWSFRRLLARSVASISFSGGLRGPGFGQG